MKRFIGLIITPEKKSKYYHDSSSFLRLISGQGSATQIIVFQPRLSSASSKSIFVSRSPLLIASTISFLAALCFFFLLPPSSLLFWFVHPLWFIYSAHTTLTFLHVSYQQCFQPLTPLLYPNSSQHFHLCSFQYQLPSFFIGRRLDPYINTGLMTVLFNLLITKIGIPLSQEGAISLHLYHSAGRLHRIADLHPPSFWIMDSK